MPAVDMSPEREITCVMEFEPQVMGQLFAEYLPKVPREYVRVAGPPESFEKEVIIQQDGSVLV